MVADKIVVMVNAPTSSKKSFSKQRSSVDPLVERHSIGHDPNPTNIAKDPVRITTKCADSMSQTSLIRSKLRSSRPFFAFCLYASISMTIAILVICLTKSSVKDDTCPITYKTMSGNLINQNSRPRSVAFGDLNGDDKLDIVVANSGIDSMTIFFGNGHGTFSNQTTYSTGIDSKPYSIAVGHFNKDNYLDIVVANYGTHNIRIYLGHGNGSFTFELTYATGVSQPLLVLVNDVNNDDQLDIIVVNYGTNTFGIIFGYNNGTFSSQMLYSTSYDSLPCSAAVGDFNNDTKLDVGIVNCGTYTVDIFLGYEKGLFAPGNSYFIGKNSQPYSIAVSDLNKDNQLDIVVGNSGTGTILILFGYGNGTFGNKKTFLTNIYGPQQIAIADINNDNLEDIIISNHFDDSIYIIEGSKDDTFGRQIIYSLGINSNPYSILIVDLNNDKRKDIVVVNNGTNNVAIMLGYNSVNFLNQTTYSNGIYSPTSVAIGHLNNDSRLDIIVANYGGDNVAIFIADSDGGFSLGDTYSTGFFSYPKAVAIADFDNDSRLDMIVTVFSDDIIIIYFGYGDGKFGDRKKYSTGTFSGPQSIAIGDFNNDGLLDIVIANYRAGNIGIFLGVSNRRFTNQTSYTTGDGTSPSAVAIGDFNNDNRLDIVFSAGFDGKFVIFFGLGNGSFVNPIKYSLTYNSGPYSVGVGDFNNDTKLDIVVGNQNLFNIGIFIGLGNGSFVDEKQYLTESRSAPISIAIADFNNDKILDIVVSHSNSDTIGVFIGIGDGKFQNQKRFSTGNNSSPSVVAFGDLNNDNRLDIIVANYQSNNIGILIGYDDGAINNPQTYSTGSATNPHSLILGDFNHDNQLDIAVANYGTGTISVLIAYGNITFAPEINYQTGADSLPKFIVLADFNNDSALDIVVANFGKDSIGLFFGYSNGTFGNQTTYLTGSNSHPSSVAVGDFNNDKQLDMVIAQYGTDNINIFLGYKYPDAASLKTFLTGSAPHPCLIALADFNSDNLLDIIVVNVTVRNFDIFLAFGNGSFSDPINTATGNGSLLQSVAVGDFNNDNRVDIVAINMDGTDIEIYLGYGNGTFAVPATYSTGGSTISQWIAVADLNNDHRTDIVVANSFRQNLGVFIADTNGTFLTCVEYSAGDEFIPCPIAIDDFNNDNILDIIVVNDYPGHRRLEIFAGYGDGMFINQTTYLIPLIVDYTTATSIAVADFNNDNQRDIVVCYSGADLIGIFISNGNGSFAPEKTYSLETNSKSQSLSIGDFNNDNRLDIVVTLTNIDKIAMFLGFGDGTFQIVRQYYTGYKSGPYWIGVGALNDDHVLDIIVSNSQSGSIGILFGFYREIFFRQMIYTTGKGSASQSVAVGDFNNDNRQDIVVANSGTDSIGVFIGYSDGTFQNQTTYLTGSGSRPYSVAVGDFNNDNLLDVVVANYGKESIGVFIGQNNGTFASQIIYSIGIGSRPSSINVFDFNKDNQLDIVITDEGTSNIVLLVGCDNGNFRIFTKYATGYNSKPCAIAIGDLNNDFETDITVANCGTNNIGFISKFC